MSKPVHQSEHETIAAYWRGHAPKWATNRKPYYAFRDNIALAMLDRNGVKPGSMLDVGCGGGEFACLMQAHGWEAYGCDLTPELVKVAGERSGCPERFTRYDIVEGGQLFEGRRFDLVSAFGVLPYLDDYVATVRWFTSLLKPGGHIVMSCAIPRSLHNVDEVYCILRRRPIRWDHIRSLFTTGIWEGGAMGPGPKFRSSGAIDRGFRAAGFKRIDDASMHNMPGFDNDPLNRKGFERWFARHFAWSYVPLYRLEG